MQKNAAKLPTYLEHRLATSKTVTLSAMHLKAIYTCTGTPCKRRRIDISPGLVVPDSLTQRLMLAQPGDVDTSLQSDLYHACLLAALAYRHEAVSSQIGSTLEKLQADMPPLPPQEGEVTPLVENQPKGEND